MREIKGCVYYRGNYNTPGNFSEKQGKARAINASGVNLSKFLLFDSIIDFSAPTTKKEMRVRQGNSYIFLRELFLPCTAVTCLEIKGNKLPSVQVAGRFGGGGGVKLKRQQIQGDH